MSGRRDLGAGVRQQRPGPARASHRLASPLALAARLSRTSVIGWAVGVGILAFFMGIIANQADKFLEDETMAEFFALAGVGSPAELFLATAMVMNGVLVAGFTVSSVLRLRTEELEGRAEPVLATPVSRQRWMLSQLAVAGGGTVTVVMCSGLLLGLGYAVRVGDWGEVLPVLVAAVVMVPPLMVLAGFTVALDRSLAAMVDHRLGGRGLRLGGRVPRRIVEPADLGAQPLAVSARPSRPGTVVRGPSSRAPAGHGGSVHSVRHGGPRDVT